LSEGEASLQDFEEPEDTIGWFVFPGRSEVDDKLWYIDASVEEGGVGRRAQATDDQYHANAEVIAVGEDEDSYPDHMEIVATEPIHGNTAILIDKGEMAAPPLVPPGYDLVVVDDDVPPLLPAPEDEDEMEHKYDKPAPPTLDGSPEPPSLRFVTRRRLRRLNDEPDSPPRAPLLGPSHPSIERRSRRRRTLSPIPEADSLAETTLNESGLDLQGSEVFSASVDDTFASLDSTGMNLSSADLIEIEQDVAPNRGRSRRGRSRGH